MKEFKRTYTFPFNFDIPSSTDNKYTLGSKVKFIKRKLFIFLKRQSHLELNNILPLHQNILWINVSAPSLGDSLMDLSSRVMLQDRNIDLFTEKKITTLFQNDLVFKSIFYELSHIKKKYDLVIIDSFSTRSIRIKAKIAPLAPFVGMFGYFNGPEVNRVLFSFHQMNNLLGNLNSESEINKKAKPSIFISNYDKRFIESLNLPKVFIAIVIGGEWSYRTYNHWRSVIQKLIKLNIARKIILIGSNNGVVEAKLIMENFPSDIVLNLVAKLSFNQTAEVISKSKFIVCCDGGLMHAANAVGAISVTLLAKLDREMQLTIDNSSFPLFDKLNVNNISVENVVLKCQEASKFSDNHPGCE